MENKAAAEAGTRPALITLEEVKRNPEIRAFIQKGDDVMGSIKYTEHGFAHASITSEKAAAILEKLGYDSRTVELARIAGFMHDIGNTVNRHDHAQSSAILTYSMLDKLGLPAHELCEIVCAIGHHDEGTGGPVSPISAALILADKSDVRRSRVRARADIQADIHDRVNHAVQAASLQVDPGHSKITLAIQIDTQLSAVMDYFEIFLSRMLLCRKSADYLGLSFELNINDVRLL